MLISVIDFNFRMRKTMDGGQIQNPKSKIQNRTDALLLFISNSF